MAYRIVFKPRVRKELLRLPVTISTRIEQHIDALTDQPRPPGVVKLQGEDNAWRIRVGNYRIVYEIHDRQIVIVVLRIAHRKDVYR